MFINVTKTLVAALVLTTASIAFVASLSVAPTPAPSWDELQWMNRASSPDTNGH